MALSQVFSILILTAKLWLMNFMGKAFMTQTRETGARVKELIQAGLSDDVGAGEKKSLLKQRG